MPLADVLFGDFNPGGKLVQTWAENHSTAPADDGPTTSATGGPICNSRESRSIPSVRPELHQVFARKT